MHTLEEIEFFFNAIRPLLSVDLGFLMLKDLARSKEAFKHRTQMDELSKYIGRISRDASPVKRKQFIELVESAEWGEKLKEKFLEQIY